MRPSDHLLCFKNMSERTGRGRERKKGGSKLRVCRWGEAEVEVKEPTSGGCVVEMQLWGETEQHCATGCMLTITQLAEQSYSSSHSWTIMCIFHIHTYTYTYIYIYICTTDLNMTTYIHTHTDRVSNSWHFKEAHTHLHKTQLANTQNIMTQNRQPSHTNLNFCLAELNS